MANKRGQNEGSIYRRKDGSWCAQVTVSGKRLTNYGKTRRECRDWLKETLAQVESGITYDSALVTVAEFLEQWVITKKNSVRPSTAYEYRLMVEREIIPILGSIKLKDLRPDQIQTFYNKKLEQGASTRKVCLIHSTLHHALNHALQLGLISRNPSQAVIKPKHQKKEMMVLDENQVQSFLLAARESRYQMLYFLAIATGLRQGELLGLYWSDIDWVNRRIQIKRQLQRLPEGKGLAFSEPKSRSGRRVIVVGPVVLEKLRNHLNQQQLIRQFAGDRWQNHDLVFPSTIGTPMEWRNMVRDFKDTLQRAGLPNIRFHDLRHTAATLMLKEGIHPKVVQERLGHSQISLTLDTYSHVLPSMQEEAAEKLDILLTPISISVGQSKDLIEK